MTDHQRLPIINLSNHIVEISKRYFRKFIIASFTLILVLIAFGALMTVKYSNANDKVINLQQQNSILSLRDSNLSVQNNNLHGQLTQANQNYATAEDNYGSLESAIDHDSVHDSAINSALNENCGKNPFILLSKPMDQSQLQSYYDKDPQGKIQYAWNKCYYEQIDIFNQAYVANNCISGSTPDIANIDCTLNTVPLIGF